MDGFSNSSSFCMGLVKRLHFLEMKGVSRIPDVHRATKRLLRLVFFALIFFALILDGGFDGGVCKNMWITDFAAAHTVSTVLTPQPRCMDKEMIFFHDSE